MNASLAELLAAARVARHYVAVLPWQPGQTRRFAGTLLRYVANYNHAALYPANLPVRFLGDIFPGIHDKDICFRHDVEDKGLPYGEAYVLACLAVYLKPRKVFEIGTFTGGAALLMARHAGPDCHVYTLDVPPGQHANLSLPGVSHDPAEANAGIIGSRFRGTEYERQITQLYGDSATFDFSPYKGQMDLVLVDGSHSYPYVVSDTRKALEVLSPQGTVVWDDCATVHPGVPQALDKFGANMPIYRVASTRFALYTRR